jgi:hypothetical protein
MLSPLLLLVDSFKPQQPLVEFPVVGWAESHQIVWMLHHRNGGIIWKVLYLLNVTNLYMFLIITYRAFLRLTRTGVRSPRELPNARVKRRYGNEEKSPRPVRRRISQLFA